MKIKIKKSFEMSTSHKYLMNKVVLNPYQTIVRCKRRISTCYTTGNMHAILSESLLPELKIWSDISQSISLQKCIQIADILSLF
jgi:hypothetical protein